MIITNSTKKERIGNDAKMYALGVAKDFLESGQPKSKFSDDTGPAK